MEEISVVKLTEAEGEAFEWMCRSYYEWLGIRNGESTEKIRCTMAHSVNGTGLPQTFIAFLEGRPAGMYQIAVTDDLDARPDLYPWLINVYVDEAYRNRGVFRKMMETVPQTAEAAGMTHLYLYTKHDGLYEKFGWRFVENVPTFRKDSPVERLYRMEITRR